MPVIRFENVHKAYYLDRGRGSLRDAIPAAARRLLGRRNGREERVLWALKGVSFTVEKGETLGIVGPNGAGKTTILKLLSRVTRPTSGEIEVQGRVSALIELGAGFHPDLTGRENIYLNAAILGLSRREVEERIESIIDFAELWDFIDVPVKRYSSGMYVRLGFAVAAHVDPDVLLVDEVLAVGDYMFKDKCIRRINEFRDAGKSMIIVSHNKEQIQKLCDRAILLHRGQIVYAGDTGEVLERYYTEFAGQDLRQGPNGRHRREQGDRPIEITKVVLLDGEGEPRNAFVTAEPMTLQIHFRAHERIENPVFYARVRNERGTLHGTTTARFDLNRTFEAGEEGVAVVHYESLNLLTGHYTINVGIKRDHFSPFTFDRIDDAVSFSVGARFDQGGALVYLPHRWTFQEPEQAIPNAQHVTHPT